MLTTTFTVPKERARAFGVFGAIAGAGGAVGLLLGGFLTQDFSWRWNLYINVVIAVVAVIGAAIFVQPVGAHRASAEARHPRHGAGLRRPVRPGLRLLQRRDRRLGLPADLGHAHCRGACCWSPSCSGSGGRRIRCCRSSIILDRNRGAAYSSVLIAGLGMFGIFLFVTYYLQTSLGYSPIKTGLAFLPMIGMLVLAAQLSTNLFVPRFGPKVMVPFGMTLGAIGMLYLTRLDLDSTYAANVLPPLMIIGLRDGLDHAGVDADRHAGRGPPVRRSRLGHGQHQPAGRWLHRYRAAQHPGRDRGHRLRRRRTCHRRRPPRREAAVHSYAVAYWWGAGFFAFGAVLSALVFRRRGHGLSVASPVLSGR